MLTTARLKLDTTTNHQQFGGKTGIVNCAAVVKEGQARVAIGCVSAVPELVTGAPDAIRDAVRALGLEPPSDVHASADYRRHLAEVMAERAVRQAAERARS